MGQLKIIPFHSVSVFFNIRNCLVLKKFSADNYNFYGAAFRSTFYFVFFGSQIAGQTSGKKKNIPTRFAVNQVERLNIFFVRFVSLLSSLSLRCSLA